MHMDAITLQQDLRKAKGDPGGMAQAICKAVEDAAVGGLATKADLQATKAELNSAMAALEVRLIKWVVATNAAGVLALAGLMAALI